MIKVISKEEYQVSKWSGGVTKQIYIWPERANYQERNFTFRISSATVDLPESDFTYLEGVTRYLTTLTGSLELTFEGEETIFLDNKEVVCFDGGNKVHCVGTATDYNLMLKGSEGKMYRKVLNGQEEMEKGKEYFLYTTKDAVLSFSDKQKVCMKEGECCHIKGEEGTYEVESGHNELIIVEIDGVI